MTDLIEKLRRASESSRELGDEVLLACGWKGYDPQRGGGILVSHWTDPDGNGWPTDSRPNPTEDMNAALKLVPKRLDIDLYTAAHSTDYSVTAIDILDHETEKVLGYGSAFTPAMAICVAVLEMKK